ncbi:MAG: thioredoxin family protein [Clostridia bacterium]|nr:thioredoxin family protein [Clostridia bacterium]
MQIVIPDGVCLAEIGGGCAGCYGAMPQARAAASNLNIPFIYIDGEADGQYTEKWQVEKLPALLLLNGGQPFARVTGFQPQEILELWIESKLQEKGL